MFSFIKRLFHHVKGILPPVNQEEEVEVELINDITENEAPVEQKLPSLTMKEKMAFYFNNLDNDENIAKIGALKRKSKKSWDYFHIYPYEVERYQNRKKELDL